MSFFKIVGVEGQAPRTHLFDIKTVWGDTVFWRATTAHTPSPWLWLVEPPSSHVPPFGWLITVPPALFGKGDSSRPPTPSWKGWLITVPPPLGSPSPWCLLQTGTPPPLGSAGGPSPPKKVDSSSNDEWVSWRQVLYFDWVVQNIIEHLCIMATYFIFSIIGLMTRPWMINERHVLRLGTSMCMMNARHCHIIWNKLYFQY